jgi:hypothetical protein
MKSLKNICFALSLATLPVAASDRMVPETTLSPEVERIIEQQKQNPLFWAYWSNEISEHYRVPNLYIISLVKQPKPVYRITRNYPKYNLKNK